MTKLIMKEYLDESDPQYESCARDVKGFEAEFGEDWEEIAIEYDDDGVILPLYVLDALKVRNFRTVLQWLGRGNIKERVNAKCESVGNMGLLVSAAMREEYDLMIFLLLNGADVNIMNAIGCSVLPSIYIERRDHSTAIEILLSWGAEFYFRGRRMNSQQLKRLVDKNIMNANATVENILSSELGGRRCKIVSTPIARDDLVGKTCVVGMHIKQSGQYKVTVEFTNESLVLGADNLERCDRTPRDPGYFVECKNDKLIRRDFESNKECQAFIASLGADRGGVSRSGPRCRSKGGAGRGRLARGAGPGRPGRSGQQRAEEGGTVCTTPG